MYRATLTLAIASAFALALAGCATSSPDVVSRYDAQRMSVVIDATVLSVRPVTVDGNQSGAGAVVGGLMGGIAGSSMGGYHQAPFAGMLGALAGAMVGNAVERSGTREESLEIMVQLRNGERRAIVQAMGGEVFTPGDPVIIVTSGGRARVSRAPAVAPQPSPQASPVAPVASPLPAPMPGIRS